VIVCANSSPLSLKALDKEFSNSIRSSILLFDQLSNADFAAATALSTSLLEPTGTLPIISSVAGLITSIFPFPRESIHFHQYTVALVHACAMQGVPTLDIHAV
jgi:hypothetical protein